MTLSTQSLASALVAVLLVPSPLLAQEGGEPRPAPDQVKLPDLPAVPDAVLAKWAEESGQINKMDGEIQRIEYEEVFKTEKHSAGKFYYEKPDKGRLDLKGVIPAPGQMGNRFPLGNGDTEEWICDGERIFQVDRKAEQANVFPIPADQQGQNIMNGPLPFLFGMPPDLAKKRYWLFVKKLEPTKAYLVAYPKWPADRQNYSWAEIVLDRKTYLPMAVKLRNPANTGDIIYVFKDIAINPVFRLRDPFAAPRGVKIVNKLDLDQQVGPQDPVDPKKVTQMPNLVGLHGSNVAKLCKTMGLKTKYLRGETAENSQLEYRVYKQEPVAGAPLVPGQEIEVTLYDKQSKS